MQYRKLTTFILPCGLMVLLCLSIAGLAGWVTQENIPTWFAFLHKPSFNPPAWVFGPVWTVLYILIGISGGVLWRYKKETTRAFYCFIAQLVLNFSWSYIFFAGHQLGWALIDMIFLIVFVILTMTFSYQKIKIVTGLLLPYLAWLCFAFILNFSLWHLN
jgi:tryptophan-rich sensory protein